MQDLLHAVLTHEHQECIGLLAKDGNIVEAQVNVTQNLLSSVRNSVSFIREMQQRIAARHLRICGIYYSSGMSQATIDSLIMACNSALGANPDCYLLLNPNQPGRIDALLYSDAAHSQNI